MKIGLIDVDSHNFPNLALMKISAHHKTQGDFVDWWSGFESYDQVYVSRVFDDTYTQWQEPIINADIIHYGGTGFGYIVNDKGELSLGGKLPDEIERTCPDYSLYPQYKEAYGFLTRGCPRDCPFCIVTQKEGPESKQVAELGEFWSGQRHIKLLDPNMLACTGHERLLQQLADSGAWVDFTQGLDIRMINPDNTRLITGIKVKNIHFAWDNPKQDLTGHFRRFKEQTGIDYRKLGVYVLTNFNSTIQEDLHRVYTLRDLGYSPYVMVYDKQNAGAAAKRLQSWVNNRIAFHSCERFEDFNRAAHRGKGGASRVGTQQTI